MFNILDSEWSYVCIDFTIHCGFFLYNFRVSGFLFFFIEKYSDHQTQRRLLVEN